MILDPLGAVTKTRKTLQEENENGERGIGTAPFSITQDHYDRPVAGGYFYSPGLGHVPEIDVPLDLPDLPGFV